MKSAQEVAQKYANRSASASGDYVDGAKKTSKDQSARAIASKEIYKQSLQESFTSDRYAKGLQKAGTQKWKEGVERKGQSRYAEGVSAGVNDYVTESSQYDSARSAADNMPRGLKGSAQNLNRVKAVVDALRAKKVGSK